MLCVQSSVLLQDSGHVISRMEHRLSLPSVLGAEWLQEMQEEARDIRKVLERPRGEEKRKEVDRRNFKELKTRVGGETMMKVRIWSYI